MILYLDTKGEYRRPGFAPESWAVGAKKDGVGTLCGDSELWSLGWPASPSWADVGDGFKATIMPGFDPSSLSRRITKDNRIILADGTSAESWMAVDAMERAWIVPVAVRDGSVVLPRAWGPGAVRVSTPLQQTLINIGNAGIELASGKSDGTVTDEVMLDWTAEIIASSNYISKQAILALGLVDDILLASAVAATCGLYPGRSEGNHG